MPAKMISEVRGSEILVLFASSAYNSTVPLFMANLALRFRVVAFHDLKICPDTALRRLGHRCLVTLVL